MPPPPGCDGRHIQQEIKIQMGVIFRQLVLSNKSIKRPTFVGLFLTCFLATFSYYDGMKIGLQKIVSLSLCLFVFQVATVLAYSPDATTQKQASALVYQIQKKLT